MSLMSKSEGVSGTSFKKYLLPAYIVISALLIIYFIYSFIVGGIYNVALNNGAQQGYQAAIQQLIEQAGAKCEPVSINLGEKKIDVVNVACLQNPNASQTPTETPAETNDVSPAE